MEESERAQEVPAEWKESVKTGKRYKNKNTRKTRGKERATGHTNNKARLRKVEGSAGTDIGSPSVVRHAL